MVRAGLQPQELNLRNLTNRVPKIHKKLMGSYTPQHLPNTNTRFRLADSLNLCYPCTVCILFFVLKDVFIILVHLHLAGYESGQL